MKDHTDYGEYGEAAFVSSEVSYSSSLTSKTMSSYGMWFKRGLDLALILIALPIVFPILVLLYLCASRGGPALYAQDRVGLDGKTFRCMKFRTMVVDAEAVLENLCAKNPLVREEWRVNQKLVNDPRITPIGRLLRATSLDELPQIWNVLRGDMSLVGPRPFMIEQDEIYRVAGGRRYYEMRPGITGIWQVEGRGKTSFLSRVSFDNRYWEQMSLWVDLGLLFRTFGVVLKRSGQ